MAVGQPETNLDTWGLRYVKKKGATNQGGADRLGLGGNTGSNRTADEQGAEPKISGSKTPSTKPTESTSAGNRISDADTETPDAIETRREGSESGTRRTTGATEGSDKKRQFAHGKEVPVGSKTGIEVDARSKLTARGDKKFTEAGGIHSGSEASNVSGIQSQTQQTVSEKNPHGVNRFGTPNKKNPEDRKARARGALPKAKAEMALVIIKCKLLKMKTKKKDFIEEGRPTRPAYRKDDDEEDEKVEKRNVEDEKYQQGNPNYNSPHSEAGIQDKEITPHPKPVKGKKTEDTKYFSQTGEELGSGKEGRKRFESDSKKSDEIVEKAIELINEAYGEMNKSNPVIVSEHATGKGKPFCSNCGRNNAKEDAKALEGTDDQQQRMVSGTRGGKKPNCPSCGHRPTKKDAPSTTSSEGGFNHVYSDVHEKKKQEEDSQSKAVKDLEEYEHNQ